MTYRRVDEEGDPASDILDGIQMVEEVPDERHRLFQEHQNLHRRELIRLN